MASEWQQWYKHRIDAWQGSATMQTLSDAGYRAFHNLIMEQFQQPDGKLIDDDLLLARQSRMGARWTMRRDSLPSIAEEVRACLIVDADGSIYSATQYKIWIAANEKHLAYEAKLHGAREAKAARLASSQSSMDSTSSNSTHRDTHSSHGNSTRRAERESEREVKTKDVSAAPSALPFATLPLVSGGEFAISFDQYAGWVKAFPGVDVANHIERMRVWLEANPTKRVTAKGVMRFAVRWLSKEQDSGAQRGSYASGSFAAVNRNQQRTDGNIEAARRAAQSFGAEIVDWPGGSSASNRKPGDLQAVLIATE